MKKHSHTQNKSNSLTGKETNDVLRSNELKYLIVALSIQLLAIVSACFWKQLLEPVFLNFQICLVCLLVWSSFLYLRKWTNSEMFYYLCLIPTAFLTFFFTKNLLVIFRVLAHHFPFVASCVASIRESEKFFVLCPDFLAALLGSGGIIAYLRYVYTQQHSIPKSEWNLYTHLTIHTQRMYYLYFEVCSLCAIWYVVVEYYGFIRMTIVSLSILYFLMYVFHSIRNRCIARNDHFPILNVCRYLFDQAGLSHRCSEIENGGRCVQVITAIVPLIRQRNEHHEAIMTVVCMLAGMVQEHFPKVLDNKKQFFSKTKREAEIAIYMFAIGVAGAVINPEYSEYEYEDYYERRWRVLFNESEKLNTSTRGDLLFGFACGTCLSIVKNLNNGYTSPEIIQERIGIAKKMVDTINSHKVYLTGSATEFQSRGEYKLAKKHFSFLQPSKPPANGLVIDRNTVKAIFDAAVNA